MPSIIAFLGYNPLPEATTLADRIVQHRRILGMAQKELAAQIGVDPRTLSRWERGEREPNGALLESVTRFLGDDTERLTRVAERRVVKTRRADFTGIPQRAGLSD
jgi:transcriptional regulator with XRE-family HTH domain